MTKGIIALALCAMLCASCVTAEAQKPTRVARIGFFDAGSETGNAVLAEPFRQELSKLGWIEGKNAPLNID